MHGERLFMCRRAFVDSKPEEQQLKKPISRRWCLEQYYMYNSRRSRRRAVAYKDGTSPAVVSMSAMYAGGALPTGDLSTSRHSLIVNSLGDRQPMQLSQSLCHVVARTRS